MPAFQSDDERTQNTNREREAAPGSCPHGEGILFLCLPGAIALVPLQLYILYRNLSLSAECYTTAPGSRFTRKCLRLIFAVSKSIWLAMRMEAEIQDTVPYIMLMRLTGLCLFEGLYAFGKK